MSDLLNTTAKKNQNLNSIFKVSSFQSRGFGVQQKTEESTPATKAELWENYQQAKQLNQKGANISAPILPIQAKLTIGEPGDKYEQEADSMAAQVMQMPAQGLVNSNSNNSVQAQPIQRACTECQDETKEESKSEEEGDRIQAKEKYGQVPEPTSIQRKVNSAEDSENSSNVESQLNGSKGGGSPLTDEVRAFMEPRFGADFSGVRVHTGSDAVQMNGALNAQAFAHGSDIYFGAGKSPGNNELTAHELTHVVQQTGQIQSQAAPGASAPANGSTNFTQNNITREVHGATLSQVYDSMTNSGTREAASVLPALKPEPQYELDSKGEKVIKAVVTVIETKEMPSWAELGQQCPPIKNEWNRFYSALDKHEDKHVEIDRKHYADVHKQLVGKPQEAAWAKMDAVVDVADKENEAYDTRTRHGLNEGTIINSAVQCAIEKVSTEPGDSGLTSDTAVPESTEPEMMAKRRGLTDITQFVRSIDVMSQQNLIQLDPMDTPQDAKQRALKIKEYLLDNWTEEEEKALEQIGGHGAKMLSTLMVKEIRTQYNVVTNGRTLEADFKEYCSSGEYKEALSLLNATLSLEDRLKTNIEKGWLFNSENEKGMLEVLRHASRPELDAAAKSPQVIQLLKDSLNDDEYYKARKLLTPNDMYEIVIDRIKNAKGTFNDDESGAYNALFDLTNEQRKQLWKDHQNLFSFMSVSERESARKMCEGTDVEALKERMNEATSGLGTDDDAVKLVVDKTQTAAQQEQAIKQAIYTGKTPNGQPLTPEKLAQLEAQLKELGGIKDNLLTPEFDRDSNLKSGSFLEMLNDDVSSQEFQAFAETMGVDRLQTAKLQILEAVGNFNDDEEAIYQAFDRLVGTIELPPESLAKLTPEQRAAAQRIADRKLREQLLNDPDVKKALVGHLNQEEMDEVNTYVSADTYEIALKKLEAAYSGVDTDEEGIFKIVCAMSAADRQKMKQEQPRIYLKLLNPEGSLTQEEREIVILSIDTGKIPTDKALDWAFGGWGDGTEEETIEQTFAAMDDAERYEYRLGYFLHKGGQLPAPTETEKTAQTQAKDKFQQLYQRMDGELGSDDLQKALDRLLGTPTLTELKTEQGRLMAVGIMGDRIGEKGDIREGDSVSSAIVDIFSDQGEVTDQSEARFQSLYKVAMEDKKLTDEEFAALAALDADFAEQYEDYVATINQVTGIASTVAAIAVGILVTALSGGTAGPAVAAFLTQYGVVGTAVIAGTASAAANVGTSELIGGSHYDAASTDGLKDAASGFVDGAMSVLSVGLATRFTSLVGLGKSGLAAEMTAGILESSNAAIAQAGKTFVNAGIKSGIEGFLCGAVGGLVLTTLDEKTWKQSIWNVIKSYGEAILKGGGIGAVTSAITTDVALEALGTYVGVKRIQGLVNQLESVGIDRQRLSTMNLDTIRALGQADAALGAGKIEEAETAFKLLQGELSPDEFNNARRELYQHHKVTDRTKRIKPEDLEALKKKWSNEKGDINWPSNKGFDGSSDIKTLQPGTKIDRYGTDGGNFVSPEGTPYSQRSLAPGTDLEKPYSRFEVLKPVDVRAGKASPWFDEPGGGIQYEFDKKIFELINDGILKRY